MNLLKRTSYVTRELSQEPTTIIHFPKRPTGPLTIFFSLPFVYFTVNKTL